MSVYSWLFLGNLHIRDQKGQIRAHRTKVFILCSCICLCDRSVPPATPLNKILDLTFGPACFHWFSARSTSIHLVLLHLSQVLDLTQVSPGSSFRFRCSNEFCSTGADCEENGCFVESLRAPSTTQIFTQSGARILASREKINKIVLDLSECWFVVINYFANLRFQTRFLKNWSLRGGNRKKPRILPSSGKANEITCLYCLA